VKFDNAVMTAGQSRRQERGRSRTGAEFGFVQLTGRGFLEVSIRLRTFGRRTAGASLGLRHRILGRRSIHHLDRSSPRKQHRQHQGSDRQAGMAEAQIGVRKVLGIERPYERRRKEGRRAVPPDLRRTHAVQGWPRGCQIACATRHEASRTHGADK